MKFNFLFQNQFLFLLFVIFYFFFIFIFTEKIPPVFTVDLPVQMLISSGGKASMNCKASGFPVPVITWFKNGIPIPRANTTGDKGLSILTLESVSNQLTKEYTGAKQTTRMAGKDHLLQN